MSTRLHLADDRRPVVILGGGLAGLTAAAMLRQHGVPFVLFEAGRRLGGLGQSFSARDGFSYDFGAHFITNRLAAALGIGGRCRLVRHYGEMVLLRGRPRSYPFGLLAIPRFLRAGAAALLRSRLTRDPCPATAAEWFHSHYGAALADEVAIPIIEAWAGVPASDLSPAVGEKLPTSILRTLFLKLCAHGQARAVAIGYCQELPESPHVWHVYPEGGVELLSQALSRGLADAVQLESPVEKIIVDKGRVVGVRVQGRDQAASAVLSTAPVNALAGMIEGSDALRGLGQFRYRPMVFVNLRLRGRGLLPDVVLWTPQPGSPFFRLTEATLSMPWLAPAGKTLITADLGCQLDDAIWRMPDEQLGELCLSHLQALVPDVRGRYLGCRVLRTKVAYPIFLNSYEAERQALARSTGIEGLHSIGRNGEFAHLLMEDVHFRTKARVRQLLAQLSTRYAMKQS